MRKAAPSITNVVTFPPPCAGALSKARSGERKRVTGNVLKFSGKQKYNYDRAALLVEWQEYMQRFSLDLYRRVCNGEVTGLMVATSTDGPDETFHFSGLGLFYEEPNLGIYVAHELEKSLKQVLEDGPVKAWEPHE